jgi:hypothetical protein
MVGDGVSTLRVDSSDAPSALDSRPPGGELAGSDRSGTGPTHRSVIIVFFALTVALSVFRPWEAHPLPIRDFAGLMSIVSARAGVSDAYQGLMDEYAREGRYQPVFMASLAIQLSVFRTNSPGWQVVRFLLMAMVVPLAVWLACRCGASWTSASVAVAVWVVVSGAHEAWYVLQVPEPLAALFLVLAALLATYWRTAPAQAAIGVGIGAGLLCAIFTKETMIAAAPFIAGLGACREGTRWTTPRLNKSTVALVAIVAAVAAVALIRILSVREAAMQSAYAGRFDVATIGPERLSNTLRAILLPVTRVPWFPANIAFLAVMLGGWVVLLRRDFREWMVAAVVLASLPLGGALLYAAWPAFPGYYALPFGLGAAVLLALALNALSGLGRTARVASASAIGVVALYGTVLAWNGAQVDRAIRETDFAAATTISSLRALNRVVVGVPDPSLSGGVSRALLLYASAVSGKSFTLPAEDVPCQAADAARLRETGSAVVQFSHLCSNADGAPAPSHYHASPYVEIDWKTFRPRRSEVSTAVWHVPAVAAE